MLIPSKHTHPDRTVLHMATILLQRLKRRRVEQYADLAVFAKRKVSDGEPLFLPALDLLYLLGLIEYRKKVDSIEYVGPTK